MTMKFRHHACAALAFAIVTVPIDTTLADASKEITGVYWSRDKARQVEIFETNAIFAGRVVWESGPVNGQSMLGKTIMRNFRYDGKGKWVGGEVVAPHNGRTIKGKLWLEDGDLVMRGFMGVSFLGKTVRFERVR